MHNLGQNSMISSAYSCSSGVCQDDLRVRFAGAGRDLTTGSVCYPIPILSTPKAVLCHFYPSLLRLILLPEQVRQVSQLYWTQPAFTRRHVSRP